MDSPLYKIIIVVEGIESELPTVKIDHTPPDMKDIPTQVWKAAAIVCGEMWERGERTN